MAPAASTARERSASGLAPLTPAEVETWGDDGGGLEAPATRPTWLRRTRLSLMNSVWAPIAFKFLGLAVGMIALSGVGVLSILSGANGVKVPLAGMLGADLRSPWLAGTPAASARAPAASAVATLPALLAATASPPSVRARASEGEPLSISAPANAEHGTRAPGGPSTGMTEDGKVILNLASAEDLRHLPGVGQKRADAIIALRTRLGRFKQVNDLLRVKGIGVRGLKKLMPHVLLDVPKPAA